MNTPNRLTIIRIIMTPIFLALLIIDFPHHMLIAAAVFIVASITDYFDGKIARKRGIETDFGKFLDPIADKMLTTVAFLGFIYAGYGYGIIWVTAIVLFREFAIMSVRLVAASGGKVIAANIWGKLKTVSKMVSIISVMLMEYLISLAFLGETAIFAIRVGYSVLLWISAVLTVISGITYIYQNRTCLDFNK